MKESLDGVVRQEKQQNKAGYTANASCRRVGRGGNARFHILQLDQHDRRTDGRTDKASFRVTCPQLKREYAKPFTHLGQSPCPSVDHLMITSMFKQHEKPINMFLPYCQFTLPGEFKL